MKSDHAKIIGHWKPDTDEYKLLIIDYQTYSWGEEEGKWAVQGKEIWLIRENLHDGVKWYYEIKNDNTLILKNPEDFLYQRGGNYLYYQMTPPNILITFERL